MDFLDFVNILEECGWAYHDFMDVVSKEGRTGTRYVLSENYYDQRTLPFETLQKKLLAAEQDKRSVIFSAAQHKYASEIRYPTVIILD